VSVKRRQDGKPAYDGKRFVVHADEKLTAFVELESATDALRFTVL
jgi:hypothetical protein